MKAEELRIGAIVQYKWFEKPSFRKTIVHREQVSVLAIDGENKRVLIKPKQNRKNQTWVSLEKIQPITLSEEVLLKCGYTERQLETGRILIVEGGGFIIRPLSQSVIVKYLHQLQNLYYALTGEELEVKLPI